MTFLTFIENAKLKNSKTSTTKNHKTTICLEGNSKNEKKGKKFSLTDKKGTRV